MKIKNLDDYEKTIKKLDKMLEIHQEYDCDNKEIEQEINELTNEIERYEDKLIKETLYIRKDEFKAKLKRIKRKIKNIEKNLKRGKYEFNIFNQPIYECPKCLTEFDHLTIQYKYCPYCTYPINQEKYKKQIKNYMKKQEKNIKKVKEKYLQDLIKAFEIENKPKYIRRLKQNINSLGCQQNFDITIKNIMNIFNIYHEMFLDFHN